MAITIERIADWRGREVIDSDGESLGKLQELWQDVETGTPLLGSVKSGLLGRHTKMIPLDGASISPDHLRIAHAKAAVDGSPNADGDGAPDPVALDEIGKAYGLRFSDQVRLESATAVDERAAAAQEARRRAEELETEAREKAAALESARSRAEGAGSEEERARQEAEAARDAARQARIDADAH